jgi:hypothetical protein
MGKFKLNRIRKNGLHQLKVRNKKLWANVLYVNVKQKCWVMLANIAINNFVEFIDYLRITNVK